VSNVPAIWPSVIAAATTLAEGLTAVRVTRGRDTTNELGDFLMVGVASIDAGVGWDSAGSFDQEFQSFGGSRRETGTVNILALSRTGDADSAAACTAVFALVADLAAAVRADPTLGLVMAEPGYLTAQLHTGTVNESQNNEGAMASLQLVITYEARI
jgi:hypothetical protein